MGYRTITCDYCPENPGHKISDECANISTTDINSVLEFSKYKKIDGIVAYASDPAAPTAAYVAEKMDLPGNPYNSVLTLSRKDLFREFLKSNNFNVPQSRTFSRYDEALDWAKNLPLPLFVKPVDSSGSKGVSEIGNLKILNKAFHDALSFSRVKKVCIESKIIRSGPQVAGDGFVNRGKLAFRCWADENFNELCNGLVPIGQSFPSTHAELKLGIAETETNRLLKILGIQNGALNFDFVFSDTGEFYFLELGPRNGGCKIPEVIKYATGVDLVKHTVEASLGLESSGLRMTKTKGYWASYMIHSCQSGTFKGVRYSDSFNGNIVEENIYKKKGDPVYSFTGSHCTIGELILEFESNKLMKDFFKQPNKYIEVLL